MKIPPYPVLIATMCISAFLFSGAAWAGDVRPALLAPSPVTDPAPSVDRLAQSLGEPAFTEKEIGKAPRGSDQVKERGKVQGGVIRGMESGKAQGGNDKADRNDKAEGSGKIQRRNDEGRSDNKAKSAECQMKLKMGGKC